MRLVNLMGVGNFKLGMTRRADYWVIIVLIFLQRNVISGILITTLSQESRTQIDDIWDFFSKTMLNLNH